ncbi:MAG: hypothetical protein AAAB35_23375, partial [Phyllobacterium sp.]|uniref:hypothetical protein n=1 Tax=Phyllobacterium sp. TaxID=1871046 RepID=UPI0030F32BEF
WVLVDDLTHQIDFVNFIRISVTKMFMVTAALTISPVFIEKFTGMLHCNIKLTSCAVHTRSIAQTTVAPTTNAWKDASWLLRSKH